MAKQFIRFDEIEDVLSSLDLLSLVVALVNKEPSYWKWVIIAAHASLQGAMICALRDSSGVSIFEREFAREMLKWFNSPIEERLIEERPQERLADFNTLVTRCRKARCMEGHPLKIGEAQARDIKFLHKEFRNEFAHFVLPRMMRAAVDATEMLLAHPRIARKLSGNKKRRLTHRLKATRAALK